MSKDRRETHLLSGLGLQVIVVALLVFVYTQAARQLNYQRGLFLRLQEQMAAAKTQAAKAEKPDLNKLRAEVDQFAARLSTPEMLSEWAKLLESFATDRFGFHEASVSVGAVEKTMEIDLGGKAVFETQMVALEFKGTGTTRNAAAFLTSLASADLKLLCPLQSMRLEAGAPDQADPVTLRLKWLVAISSKPAAAGPAPGVSPPSIPVPDKKAPSVTWGWREEPFLSPFVSPKAVQIPRALRQRFRLSGIIWDSQVPTCVINGTVLKPGDLIDGYQVTLIASNAVLLQKGEEDLFLPLQ